MIFTNLKSLLIKITSEDDKDTLCMRQNKIDLLLAKTWLKV